MPFGGSNMPSTCQFRDSSAKEALQDNFRGSFFDEELQMSSVEWGLEFLWHHGGLYVDADMISVETHFGCICWPQTDHLNIFELTLDVFIPFLICRSVLGSLIYHAYSWSIIACNQLSFRCPDSIKWFLIHLIQGVTMTKPCEQNWLAILMSWLHNHWRSRDRPWAGWLSAKETIG